jgi:hypothetical protein
MKRRPVRGNTKSIKRAAKRRGIALLFVLVVVAALSLAVFNFTRKSVSYLEASRAHIDIVKQRLLAESAISVSLARIKKGNLAQSNPVRFGQGDSSQVSNPIINVEFDNEQMGHFAVIRRIPHPGSEPEFGMQNESAKINLNALASSERNREQIVSKLMFTPGMSAPVADAIANRLLATRDKNNGISPTSRMPSDSPKLEDLSSLLTIPGVTPQLLFGEDQNQNGQLDENENDGSQNLPMDNADGKLDAGWSSEWTVTGAESNLRHDGTAKINLNQPNLAKLYDELSSEFGDDVARFFVAWKVGSPQYSDENPESLEEARKRSEIERENTFQDRLREQLGGDSDATKLGSDNSNSRNGIKLSNKGRRLRSLFDLVGCKVQVFIETTDVVLVSPFPSDPASLQRFLRDWEMKTTTNDQPTLEGRIDINQASLSTLRSIDGMTESQANSLFRIRESSDISGEEFSTVAWLVSRGLLTTSQLRRIGPEITTGGCVFNGYAIGQLSTSRTATAIFFTIDARQSINQITRHVDLPPLQYHERLRTAIAK